MHHIPIAIALEIIAITGATFLLARTKTELMARWFRWGAYILVIAGWLALTCTAVHGIMGLFCRSQCHEYSNGGYQGGHRGEGCEHGKHGKCCMPQREEMRHGHEGNEHHHDKMEHHHADSIIH